MLLPLNVENKVHGNGVASSGKRFITKFCRNQFIIQKFKWVEIQTAG